ncbi:MAG TPA: LamG domain-containing protein [Chthoniobacteraceae bacterium]|nr:LamG domain-containing protein [Chthoniobacteraceae bacterium]
MSSASASLVGWWKQDDLGGNNIVDSTGQNPEAVPLGTPVYATEGVPNGMYGAISVTSAVGTSIGYGPSTIDAQFITGIDNNNPVMNIDQTAQLTVMGWLRPATPELTTSHTYRMISTGSGAGGDFGWGLGLRLTSTGGILVPFARFTAYGVIDKDMAIPNGIVYEQWIHLAATYDNGVTSLYLNGEFLGTHLDLRLFGNDSANNRLVIGGRLGGSNNEQTNGLIDGLRVYDSVLTADEIRTAAVESVSVPEPSTGILGLLGISSLGVRRRQPVLRANRIP